MPDEGPQPQSRAAPRDGGRKVRVTVDYAHAVELLDIVPGLLARADDVVVTLCAPGGIDLAVLDTLARLRLAARRGHGTLRITGDSGRLRALARWAGLNEVLAVEVLAEADSSGWRVEAKRQTEAQEDLVPEEAVDVGDPPV